ncbi:silent information regulator protein Sir2 [Nitzschia inconspicua]|uniref:protein acetyllysine N-acetyltransferase n=1 Tax=Nitzschia inconspicua TaxID=303405 RepID=A0A9K3PUL3_9STRA|nr:silent information regulator protein Sir2 [Nitzschia inconspicua]
MSGSYASRLSQYPNKGVVGLPEIFDTTRALHNKSKQLTKLVQASKRTVILTGAGISTAARIPDFRGPSGIWTLEKRQQDETANGRKRKRPVQLDENQKHQATKDSIPSSQRTESIDFAKARPTLTHLAITKLAKDGRIDYVVTQNVDGLHRRAGLSRNSHSTVHGCVFTQKCSNPKCGIEIFLDNEVDGLSFQPTGQLCEECGYKMHDILLDWEDAVLDLDLVTKKCEDAELVLCLGTSLRINPVGSLPLLAQKFVIINLQATPFDEHASLIIRAKVDQVMEKLMSQLGYDKSWKQEVTPVERKWKPLKGDNKAFAQILAEKHRHGAG